MTPSVEIKLPAARRHRREMLLGGSALCGAVMLMALPAQAQTLPGIPDASAIKSVGGTGPVITKSGDGFTLDVDLQSTRAVINWDSFHVSSKDAVNFHFGSNSDIVLNKSPTVVQVDAKGQVTGTTATGTGGNIWFYSPAGVLISPGAVMTAGNFVFARGTAIDDLLFIADANPMAFLRAASDSLIVTTTITEATTASISPTGDVVLSAETGDIDAATVLGKGTVQVTATKGAVTLGEVTSTGDKVTVEALGGDAKITTSANGATGLSITASLTATVELAATTTSGDIVIKGDSGAMVTTAHSKGDLTITGPTVSLKDGDAVGEIQVTATAGDATVTGTVTAGDDVVVMATGGDVKAGAATLTSQGIGGDDGHVTVTSDHAVNLLAGVTQGTGAKAGDVTVDGQTSVTVGSGSSSSNDFIAKSASGSVSVDSAHADNDLSATAATSASVTSGSAGHDLSVKGKSASLTDGDATDGGIFVTATAGIATIGAHATAGDDVEVMATGGDVKADTATLTSRGSGGDDGHVTVTSDHAVNLGAGVTQGSGAKAGDVKVDGHDGVTVGSVGSGSDSSHDFIATSTNGNVSVGTAKAKNDLTATATAAGKSASVTSGQAGHDIMVTGPTASLTDGDADGGILVKASAGIATVINHATAGADVVVTATGGDAKITGTVTAGDDVAVTATGGNVEAGGATLTSKGSGGDDGHVTVTSTDMSVNLGAGVTQGSGAKAGDVTIDGKTGVTVGDGSDSSHDFIATSATGAVSVGTAKAKNDLTITAATSASVTSGRSGNDIKVTGRSASLTSGDTDYIDTAKGETNHGHIFVTATAGNATIGSHATAGDDVEVIATGGNVEAGGATLTSKGSGTDDGHVTVTSTDHSVNLKAGVTSGSNLPGPLDTRGNVTVQGQTGVTVGSGSDSSLDFIATSATGDVSVGSAKAHRDVIVNVPNGSVVGGGDFTADRDIAISTPVGSISIGSANAGDDVVMRAPLGMITASGNIRAGRDNGSSTAADADGAGDALNAAQPFLDFDAAPTTVFSTVGYDVSLAAQAIHVTGSTVAGHQPSTDALGTGGPVDSSTSDVRIQTLVGPTPTAGLDPSISLGAVIATRDIQIDSYKAVTTGGLQAGRDVAVLGRGGTTPGAAPGDHSGSGVTIGSANPGGNVVAGGDVVIYSIFGHAHVLGDVASGATIAELQPSTDLTIDGATRAANQLAIYLHYFDLDETSKPGKTGTILIRGESVAVDGKMTATGVGADIAIHASGHAGSPTDPDAGKAVVTGDAHADGDVAVSGDAVTLGNTSAGDDIVVRAGDIVHPGDITLHGNLTAGGGSDSVGAADHLLAKSDAVSLEGVTFGISGRSDIDIKATGTVTADANTTLTANSPLSNVRVQAPGKIDIGGARADRDVLIDGLSEVSTGNLHAGRDVGVRSKGDGFNVAVGGASAGDDVVIRGEGNVTTGGLSAQGADSTATDQAGDLMFNADKSHLGASPAGDFAITGQNVDVRSTKGSIQVTGSVNADTEVRIQTEDVTGGSVRLANDTTHIAVDVTAGENVLLDGKAVATAVDPRLGVEVTGTAKAINHDVAVRGREGSNVKLADVSAGDDVVIRTGGNVMTRDVSAGGGTDGGGIGEGLWGVEGAIVLEGHAFDLGGHNVDIKAGSAGTGGLGATNDVRVQAGDINVGGANAGRDVLIDGSRSVTTGGLSAGRDVGVRSTGDGFGVAVGSASAGDDVVIRANGNISTGGLTAQGVDSTALYQVGDLMFNAVKSHLGSSPAGDFAITGGQNVDVRSKNGSIQVGGAIADTEVRIQTEELTGGSVTTIGAVKAGENVLLDGKGVNATGKLTATSHDVAVRGREDSDVTLGDISAGDDAVIRTGGNITTGAAHAGGGIDGGGFGERLQATEGAIVLAGHSYDLSGHNVDVRSTKGSVLVRGSVTADTDARFQTEQGTGGSVRLANDATHPPVDVTAGENVLLDGKGVEVTGTTKATNHDVAVRGHDNSDVTLADVSAGDDVVIRTGGNVTTANVTARGGADGGGIGERLVDAEGAITLETHAYDLSGHNVDIRAGGKVTAPVTTTLTADNDVRVHAGGVIDIGNAKAGRDVLIDGASSVTTGNLNADRDVGVRSTYDGTDTETGAVVVHDVSAKDDVVIRGKRNITTGKLTAQGADSNATNQAGDLMFGADKTKLNGDLTLAGQNIDVRSTKGSITANGAAVADTDARFQTDALTGGSVKVAGVTAGQNILLDGSAVQATGALVATNSDVAVRARAGSANLLDVTAGDDVAIRATGDAMAGVVTTQGKANADGLADKLVSESGKLTVESHTFDLASSDIDVVSGSATIGAAAAAGNVRVKSASGVSLRTGTANGDILIDSGGSATAGDLTAGGDIAVRATGGDVGVDSASAGDDIVLRASGAVNATTLTTRNGDVDGAADILFAASPTVLGTNLNLSGANIDIKANGSVSVGTATASGDIRVQAVGSATLSGTGTAGRDILLDGGNVSGGELRAGGDLALYARAGSVTLASGTAGDDIAIRAIGGVSVTGALNAGAGGDSNGLADRLIGVAGGLTVAGATFDLSGAAIDVRGADINLAGATSATGANGNVRLQSSGAITLAGATATSDVLLDAAGQVSTQALTAGRDIGVRSATGAVTIASASAGDDIVIRSSKTISVTGALTARGEADGVGAADLVFNGDPTSLGAAFNLSGSNVDLKSSGGSISATGTINAGADVRLQTTGAAGDVTTGDIVAGRDVLLDGTAATAGAVKGGRDIAVRARAGAIALGSADAKDDLVLRASGDIKVTGTASAQGGADGVGAGDQLFNTDRTKLNGDFDLAGSNVDAKSSGGAIAFTGSVSAGRDVRLQTVGGGAISIAAVEAASGDILADASSVSATGALKAGGDVALRGRTGTVEVASISAGDDIAIRAAGQFKANGALSSGSGATSNGAADRLISTSESGAIFSQGDPAADPATSPPKGFTLAGGDIDIRSGGAIMLGALTAAGKSNVHLQSPGDISLGAVSADTIFARASSLHLGGVWTATTARIESTAAGGVSLGSGVTGGMELSNDQINLINAGTLEIFAGDTSGTMRGAALSIGTLSIDVAKVNKALRLYAGSGAEVRVTGTFAPSTTAANSTIVTIGANAIAGNWAPKTIKVIADNGGSIGFSTTTDGRAFNGVRAFGVVELNATNDILIGFQDFIDKMTATNAADVANVVKTFHAAQGPNGSRMLVTAGALSLRADGKVANQDTSPIAGLTRTGLFLTGNPTPGGPELTIGAMTPSNLGTVVMPQYVELYGAMKSSATVLANESTALSNLIVLLVKPSQYYRLNTCVIFQTGTCSPAGGPPNTNIAPDRLTALNILDRTDAAGAADPTVASATNEEIWKSPE